MRFRLLSWAEVPTFSSQIRDSTASFSMWDRGWQGWLLKTMRWWPKAELRYRHLHELLLCGEQRALPFSLGFLDLLGERLL